MLTRLRSLTWRVWDLHEAEGIRRLHWLLAKHPSSRTHLLAFLDQLDQASSTSHIVSMPVGIYGSVTRSQTRQRIYQQKLWKGEGLHSQEGIALLMVKWNLCFSCSQWFQAQELQNYRCLPFQTILLLEHIQVQYNLWTKDNKKKKLQSVLHMLNHYDHREVTWFVHEINSHGFIMRRTTSPKR